jgi:hypothetical protein
MLCKAHTVMPIPLWQFEHCLLLDDVAATDAYWPALQINACEGSMVPNPLAKVLPTVTDCIKDQNLDRCVYPCMQHTVH